MGQIRIHRLSTNSAFMQIWDVLIRPPTDSLRCHKVRLCRFAGRQLIEDAIRTNPENTPSHAMERVLSSTGDSGSAITAAAALPEIDRRSTFGHHGWTIVISSAALIWLASGADSHGLNLIVPELAKTFNLSSTTLLSWATPGSLGGVLAAYLVAQFSRRWGARTNIVICLAVCAPAFGLFGTWGTVTGFATLFFIVNFFGTGFGYVGGLILISNWFPRKKNLAYGWVTMGQTLSSAFFVPLLASTFKIFGVHLGFWVMASLMIVMLLVVLVFVRDTPEQLGQTPDNIPMTPEQLAASRVVEEPSGSPKFPIRELLRMRDVWLIAVASGFVYIVLIAVQSQLVPRMTSMGYTEDQAVANMAIAALVGIPGAYLWGWLGQRFSSRVALVIYEAWWLVAVAVNMLEANSATLWISLFMIGIALAGATNLVTAIVADKFGRGSFAQAISVVQPIQGIIRSTAYVILAWGITHLGGYVGAYGLLLGIGVVTIILVILVDPTPVDD